MMTTSTVKKNLGIIVAVRSVWGLTEFADGMGLQKCAALFKKQFSSKLVNRILT